MKKVLFLIQLPPPIHGASVVNKSIQESKLINSAFNTHYVDISPAKEMVDIGKLSIIKLFTTLGIFLRSLVAYVKFKPELVYLTLSPHGVAFYKDGILALLLKMLGAKMVFHLHGKGIKNSVGQSRIKKAIYRAVFNNVDIIHLSKCLFPDLEGIRDVSRKIVAVPNGIPKLQRAGRAKNEKMEFIFLSNFMRTKGADVLIRAAALIPAEYQDLFSIKLIGSPSEDQYFEEIENLLRFNKYSNVELCGAKYGSEKEAALCSSDVFILPTKNECFPLSILEAMSAGLAVISTTEGAIPDIVEQGITGEIVDTCSPEILAEKILYFIKYPEYAVQYGNAGREKFNKYYQLEIFEEKLSSTLSEIAESKL